MQFTASPALPESRSSLGGTPFRLRFFWLSEPARMVLVIHSSQMRTGCMGMNLSCRNIRVARQNLNCARVSSVLIKMSCKAVAQCVGRHVLQSGFLSIGFDDVPNCLTAERRLRPSEQG